MHKSFPKVRWYLGESEKGKLGSSGTKVLPGARGGTGLPNAQRRNSKKIPTATTTATPLGLYVVVGVPDERILTLP